MAKGVAGVIRPLAAAYPVDCNFWVFSGRDGGYKAAVTGAGRLLRGWYSSPLVKPDPGSGATF